MDKKCLTDMFVLNWSPKIVERRENNITPCSCAAPCWYSFMVTRLKERNKRKWLGIMEYVNNMLYVTRGCKGVILLSKAQQ